MSERIWLPSPTPNATYPRILPCQQTRNRSEQAEKSSWRRVCHQRPQTWQNTRPKIGWRQKQQQQRWRRRRKQQEFAFEHAMRNCTEALSLATGRETPSQLNPFGCYSLLYVTVLLFTCWWSGLSNLSKVAKRLVRQRQFQTRMYKTRVDSYIIFNTQLYGV